MDPKFSLGRIVATPGAIEALQDACQSASHFLKRHVSGVWGELDPEDREANEQAIAHEDDPGKRSRLFSVYRTRKNVKLWIITEHDRSVTTILVPEDY
jgi:hypothetical protein